MNKQIRQISRNSLLVLALLGALLSLPVTTGSSLTPALAEPLLQAAPTARIYTPEKGLLITERAGSPYAISGFAWDSTNDPGFPDDPVLKPISNPNHEPNYAVEWTAAAGAVRYKLSESTSPYFDENVVSYPYTTELSYPIEDRADGIYYYRLKAYSNSGPSRWSNVVSTRVGAAALAATPASQAVLPTVEVSVNGGAWQPATVTVVDPGGYWSWTYMWALPEADNGAYTIRARATIGEEIGPVDTITVTIKNNVSLVYLPLVMRRFPPVPYPPVLNEISNADLDGNYTVSWAYNGPYGDVEAPTSYTLQESTSADFSAAVQEYTFSASTYSMNVTGKASATYYYRVRGNNTAGAGEWSNVRSVVVMSAITDDFSNSGSGWPVATYKRGDGGDLMRVEYVDGTYRMKIMLATSDQNNYKMGLVKAPDRFIPPSANYDVSVSHFFAQAEMPFPGYAPSEGKAGIVFAANADYTTLYVFEWNWEGACAVNRYNGVSWPVSGYSGYGGSMTWTKIRDWGSCSNLLGGSYNQTNRLLVEVRDNRATVYVYNNGVKTQIASFTDDALRTHRRVGLITGSWKWTPVESRFDNFKLEIK